MRATLRPGAIALLVVALAAACTGGPGAAGRPAPTSPPGVALPAVALVAYDGCDAFVDAVQTLATQHLASDALGFSAQLGPVGGAIEDRASAGAALPEATSRDADANSAWGGTNLQEEGVDEPDVVKTDGERLLTVAAGALWAFDLSGGPPRLVGSLALPGGGGRLLVDGDRALVLTSAYGPYPASTELEEAALPVDAETQLTLVDVSDPAAMAILGSAELQGTLADARAVDGMVRVVTSSSPPQLGFVHPTNERGTAAAERTNREVIARTSAEDWLPRYTIRDPRGAVIDEGPMVDCASVQAPPDPGGLGMVNVLSVDLRDDALAVDETTSVLGGGEIVYASPASLYVTTTTWPAEDPGSRPATAIHKFDIQGRKPATYVASGEVAGQLLDQFSLSELDGDLRVAATETVATSDTPAVTSAPTGPDRAWPPATTQSTVTVLRQVGAELQPIGKVGGLGRGEEIHSVRFIGRTGYVVTFRRTDPLYTIDLGEPTEPRVAGELKIPGYSSYLHPIGDGLLVGIGQDATLEGRVTGLQLSLFDVSDPAAPAQLQKTTMPGSFSLAEHDHHAFLWWPSDSLAVVPVTGYDVGVDGSLAGPFVGAIGFVVQRAGISERGRLVHPSVAPRAGGWASRGCPPGAACIAPEPIPSPPLDGTGGGSPVTRTAVVRGMLLSFSEAGVKVSDLATFADLAWVPYP
ncbi:beta-propeller domain-containing protein [Rhabdothermincola sediminis]|uniref:beta-propeller domain-containing protein n=1 Tax=Rhabdothermincola sediminis TaxID=2751370 RepID=UPI001AA01A28|nr:beta-propeller domain-containing protein [Rhabdothermincola sediminis]